MSAQTKLRADNIDEVLKAMTIEEKAKLIVEVLQIYQFLDPYLRRQEQPDSALVQPCSHIWERYANIETTQLAEYAEQLSNYFK